MKPTTNQQSLRTEGHSSRLPTQNPRNSQADPKGLKSALLAGTVRDGGWGFSKNLRRLIRVLETRFDLKVLVVESDSSDSTSAQLARLSLQDSRITFVSLGKLADVIPERLERIAHCRNVYLDFLEQAGASFEFAVIADLDGVNSGLGIKQLAELNIDGDWAGCFANQTGPYYDIGALRSKVWQENDPFESRRRLIENGFCFEQANQLSIISKMITLPIHTPPIEVDSAFGGFAVYRTKWLKGARYSATLPGESPLQVEHVALNLSIRDRGGQLFIIPSMTNARYTEHTSHLRWISKLTFWILRPLLPLVKRVLGESRSDAAGIKIRNFFRR